MKSYITLSLAALAGQAVAFPAAMMDQAMASTSGRDLNKRVNGIAPGFNAKAQYIDTKGKYKWVAPGPTDLRGPCPGLNAFANHNYLPHDGVATIQQYIDVTMKVVGMGPDLSAFLAIYGAVFDGDGTKWSIHGPTSKIPGAGLGLLSQPQGLTGSHNKYEGDASPMRGDLYQHGNDYLTVLDQFKQFYGYQASETEATSNYELGTLTTFRVARFQQSISQNPYFFNNFFSGLLVQPAAYTFQFRFMANHSSEHPEGRFSQQNLKDWFAISGDYPNFKYTPGYEKIPDNWYRRAFGDEYTIPFFLEDVAAMAVENPQFLSVGGNLGKVNSFVGLNPVNLTNGAFNLAQLANGNNFGCFFFQFLNQQAPDLIIGLTTKLTGALSQFTNAIGLATANLTCPQINYLTNNQYKSFMNQFPGNTKLKADGTY